VVEVAAAGVDVVGDCSWVVVGAGLVVSTVVATVVGIKGASPVVPEHAAIDRTMSVTTERLIARSLCEIVVPGVTPGC